MIARLLLPLFMCLAASLQPLWAQELPQWQQTSVNDFARLLPLQDQRQLDDALVRLQAETGIQGTVVTLNNRAQFGGNDGLEAFATRLFNFWGVGDKDRNDGFMVLVLADDREARIELGRGYSPEADILAQDIMRNVMLPAFRQGDLPKGIREGTQSVITLIARPQAAGQPIVSPFASDSFFPGGRLFALIPLGFIGFVIVMILRRFRGRNRCPKCGHKDLQTSTSAQQYPLAEGGYRISDDSVTRTCPNCGWHETKIRPRPMIGWYGPTGHLLREEPNRAASFGPGRSGSGFGGGSSSGGGASGRW